MWWQRASVQWLAKEDHNIRFFPQKVSNRKKKNHIDRFIKEDGIMCVNNKS
jgi:hypothetical protein